MALSDDLYGLATRARNAETRADATRAHTAAIVGWRGDFAVARARRDGPRRPSRRAVSRVRARRRASSPAIGDGRLVAGISWIVVALVVLQIDAASVTTVGVSSDSCSRSPRSRTSR